MIAKGRADAPIRLIARKGGTWRGLYVLKAEGRSEFFHTEIAATRALVDGSLQLTGAVTFYKSPFYLDHVTFAGTKAEDALNSVHSDFEITNTRFTDTVSDAFDSDFSNGVIRATSFRNIGGDGLDISGSTVKGDGLDFTGIKDKAVSVGEASNVTLSGIRITDAGTGIVSKDGSQLVVKGLTARDIHFYTGMAYIKKPMYGPARLDIGDSRVNAAKLFNQLKNSLVLDGKPVPGRDLDVDNLYKSGPMKKGR